MLIKVLHFAAFREAVGRDEQIEVLRDRASVADLWTLLGQQVPLFARFPSMPPAAVNREYVRAETILREGDEVAFLPPVAGG
jgi:molybdopterin converting factor subunit 1